jgi:hypothetical protein
MATLRFAKVVASLPETLTPDTLYLVRTGAGFDLYVSDATGSIAYPVNAPTAAAAPQIAYPYRSGVFRIVGDVSGASLTTVGLTASRQYFVPLVVPRNVTLTALHISITTPVTGTASIGIYDNTVVNGDDAPGSLLVSTSVSTNQSGIKSGSVSYTLQAGVLYWASLISSAAPTVTALPPACQQTALGRLSNNIYNVGYLFDNGSGSTLPDPAPTTLSAGVGVNLPAIILAE